MRTHAHRQATGRLVVLPGSTAQKSRDTEAKGAAIHACPAESLSMGSREPTHNKADSTKRTRYNDARHRQSSIRTWHTTRAKEFMPADSSRLLAMLPTSGPYRVPQRRPTQMARKRSCSRGQPQGLQAPHRAGRRRHPQAVRSPRPNQCQECTLWRSCILYDGNLRADDVPRLSDRAANAMERQRQQQWGMRKDPTTEYQQGARGTIAAMARGVWRRRAEAQRHRDTDRETDRLRGCFAHQTCGSPSTSSSG